MVEELVLIFVAFLFYVHSIFVECEEFVNDGLITAIGGKNEFINKKS